MKQLYIIRHGKSDWNQGVKDFDRPLNTRGKKDAPNMGKHLIKEFDRPSFAMSSTANRAISTARLLLNEMDFDLSEIHQSDDLYHASSREIMDEIAKVPSSHEILYVFGHNPGLSDLVGYLTGEPTELKTCCVAVLELQVDSWEELIAETCILKSYISPKEI